MFEIALYFLGVVVVAGLVLAFLQALAKNLWLTFKWNVLRMPPRILDEKIVTETVDNVVEITMKNDAADAKAAGCDMTQEELDAHFVKVKTFGRAVIEEYIDRFTRRH